MKSILLFLIIVCVFSIVVQAQIGKDNHIYEPTKLSKERLGRIVELLETSIKVEHSFLKGGENIYKLPGGQLYFDSQLDLDSDGSPYSTQDRTGQSGTSLPGMDGKPINADIVPFIVLPGKGFYQRFGICLGDIAVVIYNGKVGFAIFADNGPSKKLGEGSIALHRLLGHETIRNGRFRDEAISRGVITIVFPRSGTKKAQPVSAINETGKKLFTALGGRCD